MKTALYIVKFGQDSSKRYYRITPRKLFYNLIADTDVKTWRHSKDCFKKIVNFDHTCSFSFGFVKSKGCVRHEIVTLPHKKKGETKQEEKHNNAIEALGNLMPRLCRFILHWFFFFFFYIQSFQMTEYFNPERALSVRPSVCLSVCMYVCSRFG